MMEKTNGMRMLGANRGEDGRQLAEKEKVARRGAKLPWWLPENASGFLISLCLNTLHLYSSSGLSSGTLGDNSVN